MAENQVHVGLVSYAQSTRTIKAVAWRDEPMLLGLFAQSSAGGPASDSLGGFERGAEFIGFDRDLPIRRRMDRELAEAGVELQVETAFDNIDTIKRAIAVHGGASLLPEPTICSELASGELVSVPVEGLNLVRPLGIIYRRGVELGKTARRFIQLLQETSEFPSELEMYDSEDGVDAAEPPDSGNVVNSGSRSKRNCS